MINKGVSAPTPTSPPLTSKKPLLSGYLGQTWKRSNATFCEIYSHQILVLKKVKLNGTKIVVKGSDGTTLNLTCSGDLEYFAIKLN